MLVAGNGHVRDDRAVPWYLARRAGRKTRVTVLVLEVDGTGTSVKDLAPLNPQGQPPADFIWFTPAHNRPDQCEKLRKHFQNRKSGKSG